METFSALLAICAGIHRGEFPAQRPVTRSFDVFYDMRPNKRLRNNREAGDLRRHHPSYDVIVMLWRFFCHWLHPKLSWWQLETKCYHNGITVSCYMNAFINQHFSCDILLTFNTFSHAFYVNHGIMIKCHKVLLESCQHKNWILERGYIASPEKVTSLLNQRSVYRMTQKAIDEWSIWKVQEIQWDHNERDGVSNHQPHDCLLSEKTSKLRVTGLCAGTSPATGEFLT